MDQEFEDIFARNHLRLTTPRRAVFAALKQSDEPLAMSALIRLYNGTDRTSVYRTIDLFVRLGIAQTVQMGWKQRYELTGPFKSHHHHLSCSKCGKLVDVHSSKIEDIVATVAHEHGFTMSDHTFEIRGLCDSCR